MRVASKAAPARDVSMSSSGRFVAYEAGPFARSRVVLWDRATRKSRVVSARPAPAGTAAHDPSISPDGRFVAYVDSAASPTDGYVQYGDGRLVLWDRARGTRAVVASTRGVDYGGGHVARGGAAVAFAAADRATGATDTVVWSRADGTVRTFPRGAALAARPEGISASGRYVLVGVQPSEESEDVLTLWDTRTGKRTVVRRQYDSVAHLSADGDHVAYVSARRAGRTAYVLTAAVWDRRSGKRATVRVPGKYARRDVLISAISATGRYVTVRARAARKGPWQLLLADRRTGRATLVSRTLSGKPERFSVESSAVSADGRRVAFGDSAAARSTWDPSPGGNVYLRLLR